MKAHKVIVESILQSFILFSSLDVLQLSFFNVGWTVTYYWGWAYIEICVQLCLTWTSWLSIVSTSQNWNHPNCSATRDEEVEDIPQSCKFQHEPKHWSTIFMVATRRKKMHMVFTMVQWICMESCTKKLLKCGFDDEVLQFGIQILKGY
jgi:hypothetical protein